MAAGQEVEIKGYVFKTRPKSLCRRRFYDFPPYWQGQKPVFEIMVTRKGEPTDVRPIQLFLVFSNGVYVPALYEIPALQTGSKMRFEWQISFLGISGDTLLTLPSNLGVDESGYKPNRFQTLYAFHTTPKVWVSLAVMAGTLAGIFGAFGHWLFSFLN